MWPGGRIERSILATGDPDEIWARVLAICPDAVDCFAYRASIGLLFGLRLRGGARVALKIHGDRSDAYLEAVQRVQAHLVECGFPCTTPLGVRPQATLEAWYDAGTYRDAHEPEVRRVLADHLAELHRLTTPLQPLRGMEPYRAPATAPLWPKPHNALFDFESTAAGAEWIDEIARAAKDRRDAVPGRVVIGHGDWTVMHLRFDGLRPTVVYDWDSLNADYETTFVGFAAATFTYTEHLAVEVWPRPAEARAFVDDYERARRTPFTGDERRATEAAIVYSRAYSTRCMHAVGKDTAAMRLSDYADEFL
jgi:hypothetical protein